jgi:hypothetical protein
MNRARQVIAAELKTCSRRLPATKPAKDSYAELIREMQGNRYTVETYQFPFIADERDVHSTLLERISGIVDIRADREALMLYTSFNPALDSALIWVYGPEAQAIALGSTKAPMQIRASTH